MIRFGGAAALFLAAVMCAPVGFELVMHPLIYARITGVVFFVAAVWYAYMAIHVIQNRNKSTRGNS